jgi:type I restriction enzyme S subunit
MNQTLEAMAHAIFREWFVNFKYPNSTGKLLNGLPKGWKKYNLTELLDTISSTHKFPKGKAIFLTCYFKRTLTKFSNYNFLATWS